MNTAHDTPNLAMLTAESRPKRILLQTKTHLVPGSDFDEKLFFMLDLICHYHWGRNFDCEQDRYYTHGCRFLYPNRTCYFVVDNGVATSDDDEDVEVLWYLYRGTEEPLLDNPLPPWYRDFNS